MAGQTPDLYATVTIRTPQNIAALASHYTAQMQQANWVLEDSTNAPPIGISVWSLQDSRNIRWRAVLTFARSVQSANEYNGILYIQPQ